MQPTGIEPALKASEAFVLSVRLRVHVCYNITKLLHHLEYIITTLSACLVNKVHLPFYYKKIQNLPIPLPPPPGFC